LSGAKIKERASAFLHSCGGFERRNYIRVCPPEAGKARIMSRGHEKSASADLLVTESLPLRLRSPKRATADTVRRCLRRRDTVTI